MITWIVTTRINSDFASLFLPADSVLIFHLLHRSKWNKLSGRSAFYHRWSPHFSNKHTKAAMVVLKCVHFFLFPELGDTEGGILIVDVAFLLQDNMAVLPGDNLVSSALARVKWHSSSGGWGTGCEGHCGLSVELRPHVTTGMFDILNVSTTTIFFKTNKQTNKQLLLVIICLGKLKGKEKGSVREIGSKKMCHNVNTIHRSSFPGRMKPKLPFNGDISEGGPKRPSWNLFIKLCIYSYMFKLQSPSEYSPLDAIHLSRCFFSTAQNRFWTHLLWCLLVLLPFFGWFVSPLPHQQNVSLGGLFSSGETKASRGERSGE